MWNMPDRTNGRKRKVNQSDGGLIMIEALMWIGGVVIGGYFILCILICVGACMYSSRRSDGNGQ